MSRPKWDVLWSPFHSDRFITWDSDTMLNLYEISPRDNSVRENEQTYLQISDHSVAELVCSITINSYAKCVDICPQLEPDIVASGHANGKIVLSTFSVPEFDYQGLVGREFFPKYMRSCNVVAWNPVDTHLIMSGLDKHSKEHSVLLWDVHHCPKGSERPIVEAGISETVHSAAWFKHEPRCLALGVNNKQLKVIDFRDSAKVVNVTPTKAIYNLSVNPHNNYQLLSHVDNLITIWDTRCFEKPIVTIMPQRQVTKVLWCPTRRNLIGTLQKDSVSLHLFDIQYCGVEDTEPGVLERVVLPPWHSPLSFSWHPTDENRLLAISLLGVTDYTVSERITLNWSARSCLMWNCAFKSFKYIHSEDSVYKELDDISVLTKRRAMFEYGLLPELAHNGDIAENETLKNVWQWLYLSRSLVEDGTIQSPDNKHPGVRTVLKLDQQNPVNGLKTEVIHRPWTDIGSGYMTKVYRSPDRERSLLLCGLRFDRETNTTYDNAYLEKLEKEGAYAKAAAFAVFNLCLRQAIDILNRGASKKQTTILNMVAMALSGFSEERTTLWRESCQKSKSQLSDPYLRATFGFLTADNESYESVLNENGMAVEDRVAFALMFLSDNKLHEYLKKLTQKVIEDGDLAGFLVTGASMESIQLLSKYLEITSDVQSCTLIAIRAFPPKLLQENQVQVWITSYRHLLNAWKLWFQRAKFDIAMRSSTPQERPPQQIHVSCHFCGKSISASMQGLSRTRVPFGRLGSTPNKLKMTACPNCRKPLPRCAICLMHIGTVSGLQTAPSPGGTRNEECNTKLTEFNSWFSWCLTCKHGGHSEHIAQWFRQHTECPVTSCNCRCSSLDYTRNATVT
ncbi:GATOR2 complex protein MIOS-B [Temnothorax nylanderi]|uniref:GATOR2 complex protein MIOS-B n=1 Tax=Temnothorax nylanderi TaxID=102681 RepID=UPI003A8AE43F